jgi:2-phosphoglycerate kinase
MPKPVVIRGSEEDRTPFLRGILVQSLVHSGLAFEDAYALAQDVRKRLRGKSEITTARLKDSVADLVEQRFGPEARTRYEAEGQPESREVVVHGSNGSAPFSVSLLTHSLESCAISPETAQVGAHKVAEVLATHHYREVHSRTLRHLVAHCLAEHCSVKEAERYLAWRRFMKSGTPLILLVGGITGSGKSTVATELAYRLGIVRTQSTDLLREIMRSMLPTSVIPALAYSSFNAWQGLVLPEERELAADPDTVVRGYLAQIAAVRLPLEATLKRAVQEGHHLIVDGVHVLPNQFKLGKLYRKAVVVPIMLAVMSKKVLLERLKGRGGQQPGRRSQEHVENVPVIWELQSFLLSEADRAKVPIIVNQDMEKTVREAMDLIATRVTALYSPPAPTVEPPAAAAQDSAAQPRRLDDAGYESANEEQRLTDHRLGRLQSLF